MAKRNFKDAAYTKWRREVRERDNFSCQMPGCNKPHKARLEVHHIKTWGEFPGLRLCTGNGITLCKKCHASIKGKEKEFETLFFKVLEWNMIARIKKWDKEK